MGDEATKYHTYGAKTYMQEKHLCTKIKYQKKAACRILSIASLISLKHHFQFKESSIVRNSQRTRVPCILEHWARTHHVASENLSSLLLVPSRYSLFPVRLSWAHRDLPRQLSRIWSAGTAVYTALCTLRLHLSSSSHSFPLPWPLLMLPTAWSILSEPPALGLQASTLPSPVVVLMANGHRRLIYLNDWL